MADGNGSVCGNDDESRRSESSVTGNSIVSSNTRDKRDDVREITTRKKGIRDMPAATKDIKELFGPNSSIRQNESVNNEPTETLSQQKKEHNIHENGNAAISPVVNTQNSIKTRTTTTKNIPTCQDQNWPTVLDENYEGCEGCVYVPIVTQIGQAVEGTTDAVKNSLNDFHSNIMSPENNVSEFWNNIESRIASLFQNNDERNVNDTTTDKEDNDKKKKKKKRKSLYTNGKKIVKMVVPRVRSR